jgi:hypothetical protein
VRRNGKERIQSGFLAAEGCNLLAESTQGQFLRKETIGTRYMYFDSSRSSVAVHEP